MVNEAICRAIAVCIPSPDTVHLRDTVILEEPQLCRCEYRVGVAFEAIVPSEREVCRCSRIGRRASTHKL